MQKLIAPEKEPITPFSSKVKPLYDDKGVSTILIVGGSGDYFEAADQVLMMDEYRLKDVTDAILKRMASIPFPPIPAIRGILRCRENRNSARPSTVTSVFQ